MPTISPDLPRQILALETIQTPSSTMALDTTEASSHTDRHMFRITIQHPRDPTIQIGRVSRYCVDPQTTCRTPLHGPCLGDHVTNEVLQRVSDELDIRNRLSRIAQLSDDGDLDDYIECFTEDARWGGSSFPERSGHSEILTAARERRAGGTAGPGSNTRHLISTCVVDIDGDTAKSRSIFLFYGNTQATPTLELMGVWEDELRRTPAGWRLARRSIVRSQ